MRLSIPALVLAVATSGCGADAAETGVVEIHNPHDGLWQDAPEVPFRFVLEQTFGAEEEPVDAILASITSVETDSASNVYILDSRSNSIVSFDRMGAFRWKVDEQGEGPGEIRSAYSMVSDRRSRLFISNQQGARVDAFDLEGQFVNSHTLYGTNTLIGQLAGVVGSRLVVYGYVIGKIGTTISVVDLSSEEWTVESKFEIDHSEGREIPQGMLAGPPVAVFNDEIAVGSLSVHRLEFYDLSGQLELVVARAAVPMVRPGTFQRGSSAGISTFGQLSTPAALEGGYRVVTASWPSNVNDPDAWMAMSQDQRPEMIMEQTVDLFDADWRLLYAWTGPQDEHSGPQSILHVDSTGRVYARIRNSYPSVGRYRVEVTQPE